MLEHLFASSPEVIQKLKDDHRRVEALFEAYENGKGQAKRKTAQRVVEELSVHAAIEERIVYPAIRKAFADGHIINEALEEHHLVHVLLKELKRLSLGPTFDAKVQVLKELIQHHVKEEEGEVFPAAEKEKSIKWEALNRQAHRVRMRRLPRLRKPGSRPKSGLARAA